MAGGVASAGGGELSSRVFACWCCVVEIDPDHRVRKDNQ